MSAEQYFALAVFVPASHSAAVRAALAASGAGSIGNYDSCTWTSTPGVGRFRPLGGARPAIGSIGELEEVLEERIETEVAAPRLPAVLAAVRAAHPYEVPAIHVVALHGLGGADPLHARPPALHRLLHARAHAVESAQVVLKRQRGRRQQRERRAAAAGAARRG